MNAVRAEAVRLSSTPAYRRFLIAGLAIGLFLTAGMIVIGPSHMNPPMPTADTPDGIRGLLALMVLSAPIPVLLGSRTMTNEYLHRTVVPTFLAQPRRSRVVAAKLLVHLVAGLLYGAVVAVAAAFGLIAGCAAFGLTPGLPPVTVCALALRIGAAMALYTLVGVGLGALVPQPQVCLGIAVGWFYLGESLLMALPVVGAAYPWLPGGAASALTGQSFIADAIARSLGGVPVHLLPPWAGALLLVGYAVAACALALLTTLRRDVR